MADILHRINVDAPAETVFDAIATPEGISHWWTDDGKTVLRLAHCGWSLLLLALFYAVIDVWGTTKWAFFFEGLLSPIEGPAQRVLWWIGFVLVERAFLYFLYRKKTFLRI